MKITTKAAVKNAPRGTATAPLLYWLTVLCGLEGITFLRSNHINEVVPLWFGTIVGIAMGQLLAVLRLRIWIIGVVGFMMSWFVVPAVVFTLAAMFGGTNEHLSPVLMTLIPAAICGYASLSERGGLLAFWYPTMLWMLVILDGAAPGSFSPNKSLPLVVGIATLFIAYLRARETRRVALWQSQSTVRLAEVSPRMVVRASPMRGIGQLAWTGLIGGGTFLLAATIAPKMWQKDKDVHRREAFAATVAPPTYYETVANHHGLPCCPDPSLESEHIREYLPINGYDTHASDIPIACNTCTTSYTEASDAITAYGIGPGAGVRMLDERWTVGAGYQYDQWGNLIWTGNYSYNPYDAVPPSNNIAVSSYGNYNSNYYTPDPAPGDPKFYAPYVAPTPAPVVKPPVPKHSTKQPPVAIHKPKSTPIVQPVPKIADPDIATPVVQPPVVTATPVAIKATSGDTPWRFVLPFLIAAFAIPLTWRSMRRGITLRHLTRPFWRETVDQQVSNHWQRMLVGLRDAGINLRPNEQPQAFAKRVGIAGMETCATILERVRHGVRIEADDLASMEASATAIYRTARDRAGVAGRVAGSFRWPLV